MTVDLWSSRHNRYNNTSTMHHRNNNYMEQKSNYNGRHQSRRGHNSDWLTDDTSSLSTLQRHLADLKADNRLMSVKLNEAEDCLQELESDGPSGKRRHYSDDVTEDFDTLNTREEDDDDDIDQVRLRRELHSLRRDLHAIRDDLSTQQTPVTSDYNEHRRSNSTISRRHRGSRSRHLEEEEGKLTDWGARQLEMAGINSRCSPRNEHRDLTMRDDDFSRRLLPRTSYSHIRRSNSCVGFRSVFPRPVATQHNKLIYSAASPPSYRKYDNMEKGGDFVFVPSSPGQLSIGDMIKFSRNEASTISHGRVKYVGHLPGKVGAYIGVELHNEIGKHDGVYNGFRYFHCKHNRGIFVPFNWIMLSWKE